MSDDLLGTIGAVGDRLWAKTLPARDAHGLIPLRPSPPPLWSLCHRWLGRLDRGQVSAGAALLVLLLLPALLVLDLLNLLFRIVFSLPIFALWALHRHLALRAGRRVFCPACQQEMTDPWVYCPAKGCPRRVQPRLQPHFHSLFIRRCAGCGKTRWHIFGQWGRHRPTHLICRHTRRVTGCYHPIGIDALTGGARVVHVAVAGTDARRKHEVLARLAAYLVGIGTGGNRYWPAWECSELEMKWYTGLLEGQNPPEGDAFEQPGEQYPLAYAFILQSEREPVIAFHNLPMAWLQTTDDMAVHGCNWGAMQHLLLVVDPQSWQVPAGSILPGAEIFARLLRDAEEYGSLPPGRRLELHLTICLAIGAEEKETWAGDLDAQGGMAPVTVERVLREHAPALLALARQVVRGGRMHLIGGLLRPGGAAVKPGWVGQMCERLVR